MFAFPSLRRLFQRSTTRRPYQRPTKKQPRLRLILEQLEDRVVPSASLITDQLDYSPGQTATINGSGFAANEIVDMQVLNDSANPPTTAGLPPTWTVQADANGNFTTSWVCTSDLLGDSLEADASGVASGLTAVAYFTDGIGVTLDQFANGTPPPTGASWQNGDLNVNNSQYFEGQVVPFRETLEGLTPGATDSIHLNYDFTASSHLAITPRRPRT